METQRYEPTPAWEHALGAPDCSCHLLLVVDNGKRIVGWCRVFPDKASNLEAGLGIGLLPEYRDCHIGTALVQESIDWAQRRRLTRLCLRVRGDNARAIHVFSKSDFRCTLQSGDGWMEMTRAFE